MTSVEKRRSGRKSGRHRKHSDGGYSDTSSGGSFLDETDREVSNLTDRAFRSLCVGDEAVYNDSDLCSSSPYSQRDRQLAFSQSAQDRDREHRGREELKRAAHESFTLRVQQYGQDWIHGGMYGAEVHRDPQWEVYGERTQGRVSATFQPSFVETSQQEQSLREDQLCFFSNGATDLSSQQRRSRSRVSSLIRAFNSDRHRDEAGMDGKLREWNGETGWDKSALMNIQRELSEFSTSYQENFSSDRFPTAGQFSSRDTSFYSSEVAAVARMNSSSSFMSASHSKHSMSTQVNCNSNFFIHSEFSPFKVWRDHNRFLFQQGEVSGFMHCSEFPKWYETPMYKELSREAQPQGPYRFEERGIGHRSNLVPVVPPTPPRSTSTSTVLQKASAVEKRCESELAGHYPHRKRTQSLGANRLPSQRPSTASPTIEMSRRVRDTISSVKALQQKIKMMTEQSMATEMTANQQGALWSKDNPIPFGNNAETIASNVVRGNTTPFNISQRLTPSVHAHQEAETSGVRQCAVSPQPVEHAPVRAESRGATPDSRMSSYKSRATSLLFNLKDNRKRVKNTYSPPKFKNLETRERSKQPSVQEPRDTIIDIPDYPDSDSQFTHIEESSRTNAAAHQYVNQYQSPGLSLATLNTHPNTAHAGQYSEYTLSDYEAAQKQGEMSHHSRFTGFIPANYTTNQLANGQNLHEDLLSFTPNKQRMIDNVESLGGEVSGIKSYYAATETPKNTVNNQTREYFTSKADAEQRFNDTAGREFSKVERYQQLKNNQNDYSNASSQDRCRQTNSQDTANSSLKAISVNSAWKQEKTALIERDQQAQANQRDATIKEDLNLPRDQYSKQNQQSINKECEDEFRQSFSLGQSSYRNTGLVNPNISNQLPQYSPVIGKDTVESQAYYGQQQPGAIRDKYALKKNHGHNEDNEMNENYLAQNYNQQTDQEYRNQHTLYPDRDKTMCMQEMGQRKQYIQVPKGCETQNLQPEQTTPQFEHNVQKNPLSNPDCAADPTIANQEKDRQFAEVKSEQATAEHINSQHTQTELAAAQHWAQVEQSKEESARIILAGQTGSEEVKEEQAELTERKRVKQAAAEHIKEEKRKGQHTEKHQQELRNITEEAGALYTKVEQGELVSAEQAEAERLKEEHTKTELAKTEQARIKQAVQARGERMKVEVVKEENVKTEQIEKEQSETEKFRTENIKAAQVVTEHRKAEEAKQEQMKEQQAQTEQENMKVIEIGKVKADHIKVKDVRQEKSKEDAIQGHVDAGQPTTQLSKAKEGKVEEQTKGELVKAEQAKTEDLQERLIKLGAKTTVIPQLRNGPDKIEQVKTELAKAKAELAKIKEKMRGEQKEKVKNVIIITKEEITTKDVALRVNMNKNEDYKKQDPPTQMHQQTEDLLVRKYGRDQADGGAGNFDSLREKYGLINAVTTNGNKESPARNNSLNNDKETLSLDTTTTVDNKKSKDKHSPTSGFATANTENKEEVRSFKSNELKEGDYVYSESSKEFKLSSSNYLPTWVDNGANCDTINDKVKDDSVEKLGKGLAMENTVVSQQRDSNLTKIPLERKPKSTEHSAGQGKDPHFTPPRALSHKERAQTKHEILTSKIKAHAEKEISAIKEKGFAIRDGFISKNPPRQLSDSQNINIRQRPPSQEVSKKHESTISSNITPKRQMEHSRIQKQTVRSVSPLSSATIQVRSATSTCQLADQSQNQVPKEPLKSDNNVLGNIGDSKQVECYTTVTDLDLVENQKKENHSKVKSPIQSKEKAPEDIQRKQEPNHGANSGRQKDGLKDNPAISRDHLNKKKEDTTQATAPVKAEHSKHLITEKPDSNHKAVHEDSAPSLKVVGQNQNKTPVADDSLLIMGIMVTVRERKPSENNGQRDNSTQEQIHTKEKECCYSELDKCHPSSDLEAGRGNESAKEVSKAKAIDRVVQEIHPTEKKCQTEIAINNNPENLQETSTLETRKENVSENGTEKSTNLQESSSSDARPQREMPLAEKGLPSTVTVPAKNKVLAETQNLLYKQEIKERETNVLANKMPKENPAKGIRKEEVIRNIEELKKTQKTQTAHTKENLKVKVENTGINCKTDTNRVDAEALIKHDVQLSLTDDMTPVINTSKSKSVDGKRAPLLEEKRHDSTQNRNLSPKLQNKETHTGEKDQVDDDVHIDSIAIRVVQAVTTKENLNIAGKHHVKIVPSDVAIATEHKVESSICEEKVKNSDNDGRIKDHAPACSEKQTKDSLEDKLGVQYVLSSVRKLSDSLKINNQHKSINATTENNQAENVKPDNVKGTRKLVDESKVQAMEGDYFQVQGVAETNNEVHNSANVGDTLDCISKEGEPPGFLPNKTAVNKEEKNDVVLNQSKRKTVESSTERVQYEEMEKKNLETEDKLTSKPTTGRQINNENMEAGQANHIRKHYTRNRSSSSPRERQSSSNSYPTRKNVVKEIPVVKPKPKEKVSTIPEISALADYARLKVIVSEEQENTIQEFPPNKKEGFFPLIQSRYSRRPVFTNDPKDISVKETVLPNKTEVSAKVNKEPKALIFPITEKKHQRTGMFKLGDEERQEKMVLGARGILDAGAKQEQRLKERNKSPTTHLKNQGAGTDTQTLCQVDQSIPQANNPPLQVSSSSSAVNRPTNASQRPKSLVSSDPHEKCEEFSSKPERISFLDNNCPSQGTIGQVHNIEESTTALRKDEKFENKLSKTGEERKEKLRHRGRATQHEETIATPLEQEPASRTEEEKRAEEMRIKHIMEESRASLVEEERRAAQREGERRAKEREAIANRVKERREKQREADKRAEEERKAQQVKKDRAALKGEEMGANQREEEIREKEIKRIESGEESRATLRGEEEQIKETEEKRRLKNQEVERASQEEQQRRAAQEQQQRRTTQEEEQRRAAQEEQRRTAFLIEEQRRAKQTEVKRLAEIEEENKRSQREVEDRKAAKNEKTIMKQREEQAKQEGTRQVEESQTDEERRAAREPLTQREDEIRAKKGEEEENLAAQREKERDTQIEQRRAAQMMDALQYYAITSTESERKPKDRHSCSPSPSQQKNNRSVRESTEDSGSHIRPYRPHGPASPAPSPAPALPRSNTSSPALGAKPSMFRVKDNTIRGSSFTKSIKPRFHKNFGEDFRVGLPMERVSEGGEGEQEIMRQSAGIPVQPDTGLNRLAVIKEFSTFQPTSSQDYSAHLPHHRPYSRRSIALDEDDSRSVISNMSEDVESFATSASDLADIRGLYDARPESACSYSSDVSRSMGKPPVVPPKSEKALRRAKRLTTRRIKKELCKPAEDSPAAVEKPQDVTSIRSSSEFQ
uniref:DUF4585 domain-containing protein n=1 Tax=Scophthalmus maximus TaxID=52904 RepID=A0A8D2ZTE6_SCOMX